MTEGDPIRLFVTHLYAPDESYFRVFEYLESQPNFYYKNLSTPDKPPRSKEKEAIREDIRRQMTGAEVVIWCPTSCASSPRKSCRGTDARWAMRSVGRRVMKIRRAGT